MTGSHTETQLQNFWRLLNEYSEEGAFEFNDDRGRPMLARRIIRTEGYERALAESVGVNLTTTCRAEALRGIERLRGMPRDSIFGTSRGLPGSDASRFVFTRYFKSETENLVPGDAEADAHVAIDDAIVGTDRQGWLVGLPFDTTHQGRAIKLHACTKACKQCGTIMRVNASRAALDGKVKNRRLEMARCDDCRARTTAPQTVAPMDAVVHLLQRVEELVRENAELKAALGREQQTK